MTARKSFRIAGGAGGCALLVLLAGCSSNGQNEYSEYFAALRQGLHAAFTSDDVTRTQAAAIPYPSLGYTVGGGAQRILVLATDDDAGELWTASTHVVLQMRGGEILRTVGLPHDLGGTTFGDRNEPDVPAAALRQPFSFTRILDFPDLNAYSVPVTCQAAVKGAETVTILGAAVPTVRVDTSCRSDSFNWSFTDSYWIDAASGQVWRSVQHIHPQSGPIEIELFRPPA